MCGMNKEMLMSNISVTKKQLCPLLNYRYIYVACQYLTLCVDSRKWPCCYVGLSDPDNV